MKTLILKEYDSIERSEDSQHNPFHQNEYGGCFLYYTYYDELKKLLLRKNQDNNDDLRGGIVSFLKLRNKGHKEALQIQHYVGILKLTNGLEIEVLPKISLNDKEDENSNLERILFRMLGYLKDFPAITSETANLDTRKTSLYEVFIQLYLNKVLNLIQQGLHHYYVNIEENLPCFKGKLDVSQQVKYNAARQQYFYVNHDEYLLDCPENRLIKSTLLYLSSQSKRNENAKNARILSEAFEMVPQSTDYASDYSHIIYDRFNTGYHDVIEWSMAFLLGKSFVISQGDTIADSLFFPMEKIFESFIARKLSKCLRSSGYSDAGYKVKTQSTKRYLFDDPRKFTIKPDIRIYRRVGDDEENVIFDTKWKKLDRNRTNNGISSADMYQMYAYAKRYKAKDVWLLYPRSYSEEKINNNEYKTTEDIKTIELDTNVTVYIEFIDLSSLCLKNSKEAMNGVEEQLKDLLKESLG